MIAAPAGLHSDAVATPLPLDEVARMVGVSRRTMYRLIRELDIQRHRMPGGGKAIYLDPDEVKRKRKPKPVAPRPTEEERGDG